MENASVLIVTALKEEFDAAKFAATIAGTRSYGVTRWIEEDEFTNAPFLHGEFTTAGGKNLSVALARPPRMGAPSTAPIIDTLVERLKPQCLAMCGVCAGNPADMALGDVVIAEMTYFHDEGKRTVSGFEGDHRQSPMLNSWVQSAQDMITDDLDSYGDASEAEARFWLLDRIYMGDDPRVHFARRRYFPPGSWEECVTGYITDKLIVRKGMKLGLTKKGIATLEQVKFFQVEPPTKLPFKLRVGPVASGNVVVNDGLTWDMLKALGVRTVVGLEMEAAQKPSAVAKGCPGATPPRG